ncbi:MAG: CcmD family protein [Chryseolinea sp.]
MGRIKYLMMTVVLSVWTSLTVYAQNQVEMADTMRSNGKIYVVVGIVLIVLAGLISYLFLLDKKIKKLENLLSRKEPSTK